MQRATHSQFGSPQDVLSSEEAETPKPDHGQVLVKMILSPIATQIGRIQGVIMGGFIRTPINVFRYTMKNTPILSGLQKEYRDMLGGKMGPEQQATPMAKCLWGLSPWRVSPWHHERQSGLASL